MTNVAPGSLVGELAPNWWMPLLRGILAVLFGLVAPISPATTLLVLAFRVRGRGRGTGSRVS